MTRDPQVVDVDIAEILADKLDPGTGSRLPLQRSTPASFATYASHGRWMAAPHLEMLNQQLLKVVVGHCPKLMVMMPPRHGKSELVSQHLPAIVLGQLPRGLTLSEIATAVPVNGSPAGATIWQLRESRSAAARSGLSDSQFDDLVTWSLLMYKQTGHFPSQNSEGGVAARACR